MDALPRLKIKRLDPRQPLPAYQTAGAAGIDLPIIGSQLVYDGDDGIGIFLCSTGIAAEIPPGHVGLVSLRSSFAKQGYWMPNASGVVDSDYRGEIKLLVATDGGFDYTHGDRIAQLVVVPVARCVIEEAEELGETARQDGAFGSTGR